MFFLLYVLHFFDPHDMEKNWSTFESYSRSPNMFGLELLRTNNPHKYSTLALYLSFWEVVAVWISRWCFHASESWQFFNPSLDFQKGKLVHQHLCWDAPGVSMFSKQGIVGRKMSKTTIHLHQIWFPHRWVIEWPRDALPVAFANEALVPDPRA